MERKVSGTQAVLSWLHDVLLLDGWLLLLACTLGLRGSGAAAAGWLGFFLLLPVVSSWYAIRRIKNLPLYLLVAVGGSVFMVLCTKGFWRLAAGGQRGEAAFCAAMGAAAAGIFLVRSYVKVKKNRIRKMLREMPGEAAASLGEADVGEIPTFLDEPRPLHWSVLAVQYFAVMYVERGVLWKWIFYLLLADVFVCFASRWLDGMWSFIRERQRIANLPLKTMTGVGRAVFGTALAALILAALPALIWQRDPLSELEFQVKAVELPEILQPRQETPPPDTTFLEQIRGTAEHTSPPWWLLTAGKVLLGLMAAAAVCAILWAAYKGCRRALKAFAEEEEEEIVFLEEEREENAKSLPAAGGKRAFWRRSPTERIRRRYRRVIGQRLKDAPSGSESPGELERAAGLTGHPNLEEWHRRYEKARYGAAPSTREEEREFRGLL